MIEREHEQSDSVATRHADIESDNVGIDRLAVALATAHVLAEARGTRVLDVRLGDGQLAVALARAGRQVTVVGDTAAALAECRQRADETPMSLMLGDSAQLPVADASFDTVIAYGALASPMDWQGALAHWGSKLVDGGRLIVEMGSNDHLRAADLAVAPGEPVVADTRVYVSANDLVDFADAEDWTICAVIPQRATLCGADMNRLAAPYIGGVRRWARLLSWLAVDDALFELALTVERQWVAQLGTRIGASMLVVLEKRADVAGNRAWLARNQRLNDLLFEGEVNAEGLAAYLTEPMAALRDRFAPLLQPVRNRVYLYRLLRPLLSNPRFHFEDFLPAPILQEMRVWAHRDALDERITDLTEGWAAHGDPLLAELAEAINYPLIIALLGESDRDASGARA